MRAYTYDRAGYGNSGRCTVPPNAENIARDLAALIRNADLANPIVLVGHSWAGVLIAEFLALTLGEDLDGQGKGKGKGEWESVNIAGVVLVDANHEMTLQVLDPNDANLAALSRGVEQYTAKGIMAEHKLTDGEFNAFLADESTEEYILQAVKEEAEYVGSFATLMKKELAARQPLMGDKPVYVIGGSRERDWTKMMEAGIKRGNGTEEQRKRVRELIETADEKSAALMREHLKLSTRSKLVFTKESGHFVQLTEPDLVVDGIMWVLQELKGSYLT